MSDIKELEAREQMLKLELDHAINERDAAERTYRHRQRVVEEATLRLQWAHIEVIATKIASATPR